MHQIFISMRMCTLFQGIRFHQLLNTKYLSMCFKSHKLRAPWSIQITPRLSARNIWMPPAPHFPPLSENFAASGKGRDFAKNLRRTWTTARRRWRTRLKHKQVAFAKFCCVYMQLLCKCGVFLLNVEYRLQSTGWVHINAASITLNTVVRFRWYISCRLAKQAKKWGSAFLIVFVLVN